MGWVPPHVPLSPRPLLSPPFPSHPPPSQLPAHPPPPSLPSHPAAGPTAPCFPQLHLLPGTALLFLVFCFFLPLYFFLTSTPGLCGGEGALQAVAGAGWQTGSAEGAETSTLPKTKPGWCSCVLSQRSWPQHFPPAVALGATGSGSIATPMPSLMAGRRWAGPSRAVAAIPVVPVATRARPSPPRRFAGASDLRLHPVVCFTLEML